MHTVFYLLAALVFNVALASITKKLSIPEIQEAMKALVDEVREDQMWPSRPHQINRRQYPTPEQEYYPESNDSTHQVIELQQCQSQRSRIRQLHPGSRCARTRAYRGESGSGDVRANATTGKTLV